VAALLLSGDEVQDIQNTTLKRNTSRHTPKDLSSLNCIAYALLQSITTLTVRTKKAQVELLFQYLRRWCGYRIIPHVPRTKTKLKQIF
jgi:hypothetical protein